MNISPRVIIVTVCFFFFLFLSPRLVSAATISLNVDPNGSGVTKTNVVKRNLYFASQSNPLGGIGATGTGSFGDGSILYPFSVATAGSYKLVFTYMQTAYRRIIDVKVDGQAPSGWNQMELWPSSPNFPWGSSEMYNDTAPSITWTPPNAVSLSAGTHTIEFIFHGGDVVLTNISLTTDATPANPAKPWAVAGNSDTIFPALEFTTKTTETLSDGRLRITFNGTWTSLSPGDSGFTVTSTVLPRSGKSASIFSVTSVSTGTTFQIGRGQTLPFSLVAESNAVIPQNYSELIRMDLKSTDVSNLFKPYLMAASNGYLPVNTQTPFNFVKGANASTWAPQDSADVSHIIPTRQSFGLQNGIYQRHLMDAFFYGLSSASTPIMTKGGFNLTSWAQSNPTKGPSSLPPWGADIDFNQDNPIPFLLASFGLNSSTAQLKNAMMLLANEFPYYPVTRWDAAQVMILPSVFWEYNGNTALVSYVKLLQQNGVNDAEHFRFLHNFILPILISTRGDWRDFGTLSQALSPGGATVYLNRASPPFLSPTTFRSSWIRIGTGAKTDYVHLNGQAGGNSFRLFNPANGFGIKNNHAAGEPWAMYVMDDPDSLEQNDTSYFLAMAVASRDAAVTELSSETLNNIYLYQRLYRDDGSFSLEPGSYGSSAIAYVKQAQQIFAFIDKSLFPAYDSLKGKMLKAMVMWNDFPFSDGTFPHLNRGGGNPVLDRGWSGAFDVLKSAFPTETQTISFFQNIINQESARKAGTMVNNRSFKVDGWGYAMLRGSGSWDTRMETLFSGKELLYDPGDHVSWDAMGIVPFANGTILTPRYGYDWRGYPFLLLNKLMLDRKETPYYGTFVHFDSNPTMPSAVVVTDMAEQYSTTPGVAHQERWLVQLPEYLFDFYSVKPFDGKTHRYEWGYRNLGELAITNPTNASLVPAKDPGGANWDPFGYYISNTGHQGQQFSTNSLWQADWTMNQGSISFPSSYAWPPRGSKMRVTMEGDASTMVTNAWLEGPSNSGTAMRQDFVVAERNGNQTTYTDTLEPIGVGKSGLVQTVQTTASNTTDNAKSVKVTTAQGTDWFLVGTSNVKNSRSSRTVGPFTTDSALAVVRIKNGQVVSSYCAGGGSLSFSDNGVTTTVPNCASGASQTPVPTQVSATPTPVPFVLPQTPVWWNQIPTNLRNFLEQLYALVFYFNRPSTLKYLLDGVFSGSTPAAPTPTP